MAVTNFLLFLTLVCSTLGQNNITDEEALDKAREILANYPLVDGHNDLPHQYRYRIDNRVEDIDLTEDISDIWEGSHTDIPRMREGQCGAVFWVAYVRCNKQFLDAVRSTLEQVDVVNRMMDMYPDDFAFVTTAQGIEDAFAEGKIGGMIGLEGGHSLDSSIGALRLFYKMGVRYLSPTHNCHVPWADANSDDDNWHNGLTEFGETMILEMNRLGMIVDLSHVHFDTMRDSLRVSQAPVMFSHSNAWALCNHRRNVPDDVLDMTAANGGIVMVNAYPPFLHCSPSQPPADIDLMADHIDYIAQRIGYDYVGIGSDFDGVDQVAEGFDDTSKFPYLFAELVKRGWSDENLEKLAGRNLVRVFREVEQVRDSLSHLPPYPDIIPGDQIPEEHECRTDFNS